MWHNKMALFALMMMIILVLVPQIQASPRTNFETEESDIEDRIFIDRINSKQTSWKAAQNYHLGKKMDKEYIRLLCGLAIEAELDKSFPMKQYQITEDTNIPEQFDARTVWPNCTTIGIIQDQGNCASCWALAVTGVISNRVCIASGSKLDVQISAEDLVGCCKEIGCNGCDASNPSSAYRHYIKQGLCTGGGYKSSIGCKTYSIPKCQHIEFDPNVPYPPCSGNYTVQCESKCTNQEYQNVTYEQDKFYGIKVESIKGEKQMQLEIMHNGPITAGFRVMRDFIYYHRGVYHYVDGINLGNHLVRIVGWGVENGMSYWLVANSWNEHWAGLDGFFMIRRGTNECGIEEMVVQAPVPKPKIRTQRSCARRK